MIFKIIRNDMLRTIKNKFKLEDKITKLVEFCMYARSN